MSLDKGIANGREHRKPYYDSRRFDWTYRCHGSCGWCRENRLHRRTKENDRTKTELRMT